MSTATIVVPCYNEARRLRLGHFKACLAGAPRTQFLFVDDGSTDGTAELVSELCRSNARVRLLKFPANQGKAEAVRQGLLAALENRTDYVGFWDADLATPLCAIADFCRLLDQRPDIDWVFGSRVRLLGRSIERLPARHYLGRVWATAVSLLLRLPIYDTQCGAKVFRATEELRRLLSDPFVSRWVFDVELIARLIRSRRGTSLPAVSRAIYELPLVEWRDVAGSKLKPRDFCRAGFELLRIYRCFLRGKDAHPAPAPARQAAPLPIPPALQPAGFAGPSPAR
jgi:glycosyltransferase involved in cell wall biosynthesis